MIKASVVLLTILAASAPAQQWRKLFNGRDLSGWEVRGESLWHVLPGGILVGQRPVPGGNLAGTWPLDVKQYRTWLYQQAWLYTREEFENFDLRLDFWIPVGGNSGVSIRDTSRASETIGPPPRRTPAHIGYEIQLSGSEKEEKYPSGSVYLFAGARPGLHRQGAWNRLEIESRPDLIRTRVNGQPAAETPGDPKRPKAGPIGLQLHDQFSWAMFRNIEIRERRANQP